MYVISIFHQYFGGLIRDNIRRKGSRKLLRVNTTQDAYRFHSLGITLSYICQNHYRFSTYSDVKIYECDNLTSKIVKLEIDIGKRFKHFNSLTGIYKIDSIRNLIISNNRYDYMIRINRSTRNWSATLFVNKIKSELKSLGIKIKDIKIDLEYYSVLLFINEEDFVKFRLGQSITSNLDFISIKQVWENYES